MKKIIGCFLLALLTSACGWHLRGSVNVQQQLSQIYISAEDGKSALVSELEQLLKANRVTLLQDSSAAEYSLNILNESKEKRTAGVGTDSLSSAYEITLKVDYEIHFKSNDKTTKATASSVRSFNYNTAAINSATQEEVLLEKEMRQDLAQQILRRLNAAVAHPPSASDKSDKEPTKNPSGDSNGKTAP